MRGGTCRLHLHEKWNLPQTLRLTAAGASGSFFVIIQQPLEN